MAGHFTKRCYYYDDRGEPANGYGCPRAQDGSCHFAHPGTKAWDRLDPVTIPVFLRKRSPPPRSHSPRRRPRSPSPRRRPRSPSPSRRPPPKSLSPLRKPRSPSPHRRPPPVKSPSPSLSRRIQVDIPARPPPPSPMQVDSEPVTKSAFRPPPAPPSFGEPQLASEKAKIWSKRVSFLSDYMKAETEERNINLSLKTFQSTLASGQLSASSQNQFQSRVDACKIQLQDAAHAKKKALTGLIEDDKWPVVGRGSKQDDAMADLLVKLGEASIQVNDLVSQLGNTSTAIPDVQEGPSSRPLKRRRAEEPPSTAVTEHEVESLHDQLQSLLGTLSTLENDMVAREADFTTDILREVEDKLEEDREASLSESIVSHWNQQLDQYQVDLTALEGEINQVMKDAKSSETDVDKLKPELEISYQRSLETQQLVRELLDQRDQDLKQIDALNAALDAYRTSAQPQTQSDDYVLSMLEETIVDSVRASIRPSMDELREGIQEMLNVQQTDYDALWSKLHLTFKTVAAVAASHGVSVPAVL
ncbi:hypothetical protein C8J56DRAFT_955478 [Mycena floridula]|nr:hypothetical protein C8J56DRAFT_955478 [Mycena floridula]